MRAADPLTRYAAHRLTIETERYLNIRPPVDRTALALLTALTVGVWTLIAVGIWLAVR